MSEANPPAATYALLAALLDAGRAIHFLSLAVTIVSLAGLGLSSALSLGLASACLLAVAVVIGAFETYLAVRVGFDAAIFRLVAAGEAGWDEVDRGLAGLNLAASPAFPRSPASRIKGALRLLRRQGLTTASQALLALAAFAARA